MLFVLWVTSLRPTEKQDWPMFSFPWLKLLWNLHADFSFSACFCVLKLPVKYISIKCPLYPMCPHNIVPILLKYYRHLLWMPTYRPLGISDLCLLLQSEPAQVCLTCELCKIFSELFFKLWFCPRECMAFSHFKWEDVCYNKDRKAQAKNLVKEC